MDWLSALQNVPVVGAGIALAFLLITTFANGWKERREGKREGIEQSDRRHAQASAEKDRAIQKGSDNVKDVADRVRDRGDYNDERLPDGEGAALPGYHYRDRKPGD